MSISSPSGFDGFVERGYESLAAAMATNLQPTVTERATDPGDLGAAITVIHKGAVVIDGWAGCRDLKGTPWQRDTLVNMYSVGKPVAAVLALDAVERGELQLDVPLVEVWPELAEHSPTTTLRQVLTHQAGLPAAAEDLADGDILDWNRMCEALANTPPWWPPGTAHGYHVNTYGFLAGEPVCRTSKKTFREALQDRICVPHQLDLHIGVPTEHLDRASVIDIPGASNAAALPEWPEETPQQAMAKRTYFNPRTMSGMGIVNTDGWRQASVPSTNGHATARAIASFYAALLPGAAHPLLPDNLLAEATREQTMNTDMVLGRPTRFGLGFQLHQDERPIGTSPDAYGHFGFGGSLGFADPANDLAFAYLINRPGDRWQNPRTLRLLNTLRSLL